MKKQSLDAAFLLDKYSWDYIETLDNWLFVFDNLPPKMKLIVDFKIQGMTDTEIAKLMKTTVNNVRVNLHKAKKRFIKGEDISYAEGWGYENI